MMHCKFEALLHNFDFENKEFKGMTINLRSNVGYDVERYCGIEDGYYTFSVKNKTSFAMELMVYPDDIESIQIAWKGK